MSTDENNKENKEKASLFFFRNMDTVRLVAFCVSPTKDLLDDIVHDTYIQFVENAGNWDYSRDLLPLLKKITRNMALQYWKQYNRGMPESVRKLGELIRAHNDSDASPSLQHMLSAMQHCMDQLSPENKAILESHYIHRESIVELAKKRRVKVNTLYSFFTRIRNTIRKCIESKTAGGDSHAF